MTTETKPRASRAKKEEPIEGEVIEEAATELAVTKAPPPVMDGGTYALAMLSDEEFESSLQYVKQGRQRVERLQREVMEVDVDYGLIPGTPKPTLFKPGAEKLCLVYRHAARLEVQLTKGDNVTSPPLYYHAQCYLHLGSTDGPVIATGHGTANGWEKRYLRGASKTCPQCGQAALIKSKYRSETWHCFAKKGGCGADVPFSHPDLANQTETKGAVTDAYDLANTLMKMAEKRAFVDATLRATATSGLFTQDVVEDPRDDEDTVVTTGGAAVDADGVVVGRRDDTPAEKHQQVAGETGTYVPNGKEEVEKVLGGPDPLAEEPEFAPSDIPGVGLGGSTAGSNGPQVAQLKAHSKALKLGPYRLADEISTVLGGGLDSTQLPEDPHDAIPLLQAQLDSMSAGDTGKVISHLRKMLEAAP